MKAFTILTAITSMAIGLQSVLAVPLTPDHVAKRWIPCWEGNSQIECKAKRQAATGSAVPPPAPTNEGASSSCAQWFTVSATKDERACTAALADGNISLDDFRKLNPFVNDKCTNLWTGSAYCVGNNGPLNHKVSTVENLAASASASPSATVMVKFLRTASASNSSLPAPSSTDTTAPNPASMNSAPPASALSASVPEASSPPSATTPAPSASLATTFVTTVTETMQPPDRVTNHFNQMIPTATSTQ